MWSFNSVNSFVMRLRSDTACRVPWVFFSIKRFFSSKRERSSSTLCFPCTQRIPDDKRMTKNHHTKLDWPNFNYRLQWLGYLHQLAAYYSVLLWRTMTPSERQYVSDSPWEEKRRKYLNNHRRWEKMKRIQVIKRKMENLLDAVLRVSSSWRPYSLSPDLFAGSPV